jgi:nucleoside-diphosphate-sugar epimerase
MTFQLDNSKHALVVGLTGITGHSLTEHLLSKGWKVTGICRKPPLYPNSAQIVLTDVTDKEKTKAALAQVNPTHVFFCTWSRQATEAENCRVNSDILKNVFDGALSDGRKIEHASLVTGLKHYLGPFDKYGADGSATPFREEQPRLPYENFYYAQEDVLFDYAKKHNFAWSVHRPHTVIGWAIGNAMNMGVTLAVYGTICRETGRPFAFPGSKMQYEGIVDVTDARILARQLEWAATSPQAANQAFNIVNGDVFRWRRMWTVVAMELGVEPAPYSGEASPLEKQMVDAGPIWKKIATKYGLAVDNVNNLASWWHTDLDLGRPIEAFTDMSKSRNLGFLDYQETDGSFRHLFAELRANKIIPN